MTARTPDPQGGPLQPRDAAAEERSGPGKQWTREPEKGQTPDPVPDPVPHTGYHHPVPSTRVPHHPTGTHPTTMLGTVQQPSQQARSVHQACYFLNTVNNPQRGNHQRGSFSNFTKTPTRGPLATDSTPMLGGQSRAFRPGRGLAIKDPTEEPRHGVPGSAHVHRCLGCRDLL